MVEEVGEVGGVHVLVEVDAAVGEFAEGSLLLQLCWLFCVSLCLLL